MKDFVKGFSKINKVSISLPLSKSMAMLSIVWRSVKFHRISLFGNHAGFIYLVVCF